MAGSLSSLLLFAAACDSTQETNPSGRDDFQRAEVVRVVDGDTIVVRLDGREERVRYIGIDAPESVEPDAPVECFGPEASEANASLVEGQTVWLEADEENRDRFGRWLRYVYIDVGSELVLVNQLLVEDGYAEAGSFPPNERYQDDLFAAEREARRSGTGLWSACN